jgi:hypothetical protein
MPELRRTVPIMDVYRTPDGRWRIQVTTARIEVYERVGGSLVAQPEVVLRSPPDLAAWLAGHGYDIADLIED